MANTPELLEKKFYEDEEGNRFPPKHLFSPDLMSEGGHEKFSAWWTKENERYKQDPSLRYDIWQNLLEYCKQDVKILRLCKSIGTISGFKFGIKTISGFEEFVRTAKELEGLDPLESITQPSYENRCYREKFMPKDSIALLPPQGYNETTSKEALGWLEHQRKTLDLLELRHARNSREIKVGGIKLDGWGTDALGNKYALQYHGCQ